MQQKWQNKSFSEGIIRIFPLAFVQIDTGIAAYLRYVLHW